MLRSKMALFWTGSGHRTPDNVGHSRDYVLIERAGNLAAAAVHAGDFGHLTEAVRLSYEAQLGEGMERLPAAPGALAWKYCGGGWGGYALYLFPDTTSRDTFAQNPGNIAIEPYLAP